MFILKIVLGAIITSFMCHLSSKLGSKIHIYYLGVLAGVLTAFINRMIN